MSHPYLEAQLFQVPGSGGKTIAFSTASRFTTLVSGQWYELWATADVYVALGGATVTASTGSYTLPSRTISQPFQAGSSAYIAATRLGTTSGTLYINPIWKGVRV
jgi:hypothetical protein